MNQDEPPATLGLFFWTADNRVLTRSIVHFHADSIRQNEPPGWNQPVRWWIAKRIGKKFREQKGCIFFKMRGADLE
jgi:hypothetical protein